MRYSLLLFAFVLLLAPSASYAGCDKSQSTNGMFVFPSESATATFLADLKASVSANDKAATTRLVAFPVFVQLGGKSVHLNRRGFVQNFQRIFNSRVRAALLSAQFHSIADYDCVFWNSHGMMVGNGEIWFNVIGSRIKVVTINN